MRCTNAGRQCPGYLPDTPLSFVHYSAETGKRSDKEQVNEPTSNHVNGVKSSPPQLQMYMPRRERPPEHLFESLIGQHTDKGKQDDEVPAYFTQLMAPHRLHFTPGEFRLHFETLWASFLTVYSRTSDYWPAGCTSLALRHEALDLALIALSAQHLAAAESNGNYRVLGLTAYDKSLKLFKALVDGSDGTPESSAILAVISLIYFLIEVSQQLESVLGKALQYGWSAVDTF